MPSLFQSMASIGLGSSQSQSSSVGATRPPLSSTLQQMEQNGAIPTGGPTQPNPLARGIRLPVNTPKLPQPGQGAAPQQPEQELPEGSGFGYADTSGRPEGGEGGPTMAMESGRPSGMLNDEDIGGGAGDEQEAARGGSIKPRKGKKGKRPAPPKQAKEDQQEEPQEQPASVAIPPPDQAPEPPPTARSMPDPQVEQTLAAQNAPGGGIPMDVTAGSNDDEDGVQSFATGGTPQPGGGSSASFSAPPPPAPPPAAPSGSFAGTPVNPAPVASPAPGFPGPGVHLPPFFNPLVPEDQSGKLANLLEMARQLANEDFQRKQALINAQNKGRGGGGGGGGGKPHGDDKKGREKEPPPEKEHGGGQQQQPKQQQAHIPFCDEHPYNKDCIPPDDKPPQQQRQEREPSPGKEEKKEPVGKKIDPKGGEKPEKPEDEGPAGQEPVGGPQDPKGEGPYYPNYPGGEGDYQGAAQETPWQDEGDPYYDGSYDPGYYFDDPGYVDYSGDDMGDPFAGTDWTDPFISNDWGDPAVGDPLGGSGDDGGGNTAGGDGGDTGGTDVGYVPPDGGYGGGDGGEWEAARGGAIPMLQTGGDPGEDDEGGDTGVPEGKDDTYGNTPWAEEGDVNKYEGVEEGAGAPEDSPPPVEPPQGEEPAIPLPEADKGVPEDVGATPVAPWNEEGDVDKEDYPRPHPAFIQGLRALQDIVAAANERITNSEEAKAHFSGAGAYDWEAIRRGAEGALPGEAQSNQLLAFAGLVDTYYRQNGADPTDELGSFGQGIRKEWNDARGEAMARAHSGDTDGAAAAMKRAFAAVPSPFVTDVRPTTVGGQDGFQFMVHEGLHPEDGKTATYNLTAAQAMHLLGEPLDGLFHAGGEAVPEAISRASREEDPTHPESGGHYARFDRSNKGPMEPGERGASVERAPEPTQLAGAVPTPDTVGGEKVPMPQPRPQQAEQNPVDEANRQRDQLKAVREATEKLAAAKGITDPGQIRKIHDELSQYTPEQLERGLRGVLGQGQSQDKQGPYSIIRGGERTDYDKNYKEIAPPAPPPSAGERREQLRHENWQKEREWERQNPKNAAGGKGGSALSTEQYKDIKDHADDTLKDAVEAAEKAKKPLTKEQKKQIWMDAAREKQQMIQGLSEPQPQQQPQPAQQPAQQPTGDWQVRQSPKGPLITIPGKGDKPFTPEQILQFGSDADKRMLRRLLPQ